MKKRIIGLILVVAMLTLSLVSCGYSFAKDDLTAYATFSAENKAAIETAYSELIGGADFMSVAAKYGEDPELSNEGFYILKGYMNEKYEKAAFSLEIDKFSEIIEDEGGFYIIKRLEQDSFYVIKNFETLAERYQNYTFIEMINDTHEALEFIPNEYLSSIDMFAIE